MYKVIHQDQILTPYLYAKEEEYEKVVVKNAETIFGEKSIYFDIKKLIGKQKAGASIPDGYLIDLKFHSAPKLYFIEIELESHDVYGHIGEQLLRFSMSFDDSKYKIKNMLLDEISKDSEKQKKINQFLKQSRFDNANHLIDYVVYDNPLATVVVISTATEQLSRVLSKLTDKTDIVEFETYFRGEEKIHRFTPFQDDITESDEQGTIDIDTFDTIVVPAREDGFNEVFIGQNCWYSIRISSAMLDKIKFIAAYQTAPISAITHYAEVDRIEKYQDSDKYIVFFKEKATQINPIPLGANVKGIAPQAPRYTNLSKLKSVKSVKELFGA